MKRSHVVAAAITIAGAGVLAAQTPAAQSATNYFDQTRTVAATRANIATCPPGWKVTGGGYADVPRTSNTAPDQQFESVQILKNGPKGPNAWEVQGVHTISWKVTGEDGRWTTKGEPFTVTVYAVCTR